MNALLSISCLGNVPHEHLRRPMFRRLLERYLGIAEGALREGFRSFRNINGLADDVHNIGYGYEGVLYELRLSMLWEEYKKTLTPVEQELL